MKFSSSNKPKRISVFIYVRLAKGEKLQYIAMEKAEE